MIAVGLVLLGAACANKAALNVNTAGYVNSSVNENTNIAANENANLEVNTNLSANANTNTSTDNGPIIKGSLRLDTPKMNMQVVSPFEVTGQSDTSLVYVRIKNLSGATLFTEPVTVRGGTFTVNITLNVATSRTETLEVYQKNSAGAETNVISLPIEVKVAGSTNTNSTVSTNANSNSNANTNTSTNQNTNTYYPY